MANEEVPRDKGIEKDMGAGKEKDLPEESMEKEEEDTKAREEEEKLIIKEQRIHDLMKTTKYSEFY